MYIFQFSAPTPSQYAINLAVPHEMLLCGTARLSPNTNLESNTIISDISWACSFCSRYKDVGMMPV